MTGAARLVCLKFAEHTKYFPRGAFRSQKGTATSMEPLILLKLEIFVNVERWSTDRQLSFQESERYGCIHNDLKC